MIYDINKMKQALFDIQTLADEVEKGYHIPKRFRKAPFTPEMRSAYVTYLRREAFDLSSRIKHAVTMAARKNAPCTVVH